MPGTAAFTKSLLVFFLVPLLTFTSCNNSVQHSNFHPDTLNVASFRFFNSLLKYTLVKVEDKNAIPDEKLFNIEFTDSLPGAWRSRVPPSVIEKELLLKFYLSNTSDSLEQLYFYPAAYCNSIRLFKMDQRSGTLHEMVVNSTPEPWRLGFRLIEVAPKDTAAYYARLNILRTNATALSPVILQKDFVEPFISAKVQYKKVTTMFTYLVVGIMVMMIIYSIAAFLLNRNKEFLYYSGYAFCIGLLLFLKSFLQYNYTRFNFFFESYWDFLVQCLGVVFYFQFVRSFLDIRHRHPFMEKIFRVSEIIISVLLAVYTILYFFTDNFVWLDFFENFTKQILLLVGIVFVVYGVRRNDSLMRWLVWGNIWLIFFSVVSFLLILRPSSFVATNSSFAFLNDAIVYYELGIALELIMFLRGLAYKNRRDIVERTRESERLQLENERKEMEKQMAVLAAQQHERDRISADMHDELGSGVTAIRLMSEIVKSKMKEATLPEVEKISNSANDLITKMNTIIWTMTSSNDTVESLITYLRIYAFEFFDSTNIECKFNMPDYIPKVDLSGERRRNIFLAVKEALNNVLKHSRASIVQIDVSVSEKLTISIYDNGSGIDFEQIRRFGNGLKNMQTRLDNINGKFNIRNEQGTIAIFEITL